MKYIVFEEGAIEEIVSNRLFQTIEFDLAHALYDLMIGKVTTTDFPHNISTIKLVEGIAFSSRKASKNSHFLIIDLEQSRLLEQEAPGVAVFLLQKILRFAKKLWQNMPLNYSERVIPASTKAVIFPLRYQPTPYRVVIEQAPCAERLKKRGFAGKFLLVYKAGYEKGDVSTEKASHTNFKKAFEQVDKVISESHALISIQSAPSTSVVQVSELDTVPDTSGTSLFLSFDDWMRNLTNIQKDFVDAQINGAHRIEGAAGTGKTICLMLKAIAYLKKSEADSDSRHIVFVTHSEATKRAIIEFLKVLDLDNFANRDRNVRENTLKVCTLSELCAEQLAQRINPSEFIDRDALESKEMQRLYVNDAYDDAMKNDFPSYKRFLSSDLRGFLEKTDAWAVTEMLQHEISVLIKGRASEDFEVYKNTPPLKYGIPIKSDPDKGFVFAVFRNYQNLLAEVSQFDTDDVVLTAIGQLDTPVWRRRRARDGYDAIFIDETHLFNINELQIFHYFTKSDTHFPIVYSVDRAQAVGDHGWTNQDISEALSSSSSEENNYKLQTIFRSSPQIVELAFSILSSGATLFTNFDNPLDSAASSFTDDEERKSALPQFRSYLNDQAMIEGAYRRAEALQKDMKCKKGNILIVGFDAEVVERLQEYAKMKNKPHILLKRRGDIETVGEAENSGKFLVAHVDFVGGLECFGVVAVGVDKGRLPPARDKLSDNSKQFLSYYSHNRLYVAVSRAKFRVELLGNQTRGPSDLVEPAIQAKFLEMTLQPE